MTIDCVKSHLFEKVSGFKEAVSMRADLKPAFKNVSGIIRRLAECGESNSLLIIGPKGSGKSYVIDEAIADNKDAESLLIVRLNGLIQTDDRFVWRFLLIKFTLSPELFFSKSFLLFETAQT